MATDGGLRGEVANLAYSIAELGIAVAQVRKALIEVRLLIAADKSDNEALVKKTYGDLELTSEEIDTQLQRVFDNLKSSLVRLAGSDA